MVNWDVVSHDWDGMKQQLRGAAVDLEKGWKRITGWNFLRSAKALAIRAAFETVRPDSLRSLKVEVSLLSLKQ